jgi:hypothetical protein
LEGEITCASQEYSMQVQRIVGEAEKGARILGLLRGSGEVGTPAVCGASDAIIVGDESVSNVRASGRSVLRICLDWISEDRRRRDAQGTPQDSLAPCVDWNEERCHYQAITRSMETKFEQLSKLKRVLLARQAGVKRVGPVRGGY